MFYKLNNFVGRLLPSTQAESLRPQGLNPQLREPSVFIFDSKSTKPAVAPPAPVKTATRPASTAAAQTQATPKGIVPANARYQKIQEMQSLFLKQDGLLVWQKLGSRDRLGYYVTLGIMFTGLVFSLGGILRMSFPETKKN